MKKIYLILLFVLSGVLVVNAQTTKGKFMIAGSSGLDFMAETQKYKTNHGDGTTGKLLQISIDPQAGWFLMDNLAAGLILEMSYEGYKENGAEDRASTTYFVLAPFARYYFGTTKIRPFAEASVGLGPKFTRQPIPGGVEKDETLLFALQFKGGAAFFMSDNFSLDMSLGYRYLSDRYDSDYRDVNSDFLIQAGFTVYW